VQIETSGKNGLATRDDHDRSIGLGAIKRLVNLAKDFGRQCISLVIVDANRGYLVLRTVVNGVGCHKAGANS
jgi:hypothetical protein